jgi:hypothetical protein
VATAPGWFPAETFGAAPLHGIASMDEATMVTFAVRDACKSGRLII